MKEIESICNFVKMLGKKDISPTKSMMYELVIATESPLGDFIQSTLEENISSLIIKYKFKTDYEDSTSKTFTLFESDELPDWALLLSITIPGPDYDEIMGKKSLANPVTSSNKPTTIYPRQIRFMLFER